MKLDCEQELSVALTCADPLGPLYITRAVAKTILTLLRDDAHIDLVAMPESVFSILLKCSNVSCFALHFLQEPEEQSLIACPFLRQLRQILADLALLDLSKGVSSRKVLQFCM